MMSWDRVAPIERRKQGTMGWTGRILAVLMCLAVLAMWAPALHAQTGGEAGIQGTVTDPTGAAVPHATVIAKNNATGVEQTRETTGDGLFTISPILPGSYTVTVKAQGFGDYIQKNLQANALVLTPLNVTMKVGGASDTVEVTSAPPTLETTNATLGLTVENETYANLPLIMNNQQRDPTAIGNLAPGTAGGTRLPVVGGTGNYLGQLYLDGLPATTVSQQGDNRLVSQAVTVDAIDQLQVITSTPPAEYSGAGAENFTMKSGSLKYHGSVKDFIRNTAFDAWQFSKGTTKPVDHQNEFSATFGGHVPGTKRLFFFVAYDRYHNRTQANPQGFTVPTAQMKAGDFTQLACLSLTADQQPACIQGGGPIGNGVFGTNAQGASVSNTPFLYDPSTTVCSGVNCSRQGFSSTKGGVVTNNVIPASYISPIAKAMQQWLPDPNVTNSLTLNYVAGLAKGFDNHLYNYRVDFQATPNHRISTVGAMGTVNYLNNYGTPYLPLPYVGGDGAAIYPKVFDVQDAYTISNTMVNQLKFGFVRFFQNIYNATSGTQYGINNLGVTNLPGGQAGNSFPGVSFTANTKFPNALQTWTGNSDAIATQLTTPNNYALVDNLQWVKGSHTLTFGITVQWQQINNANPATLTGILSLPFDNYATANFGTTAGTTNVLQTTSGYSYASFLLGAVGATSTALNPVTLNIRPVSEVGGRYRPIAPYVEDTWKVSSKLTIDAGLRWDYLPPYHEVKDRWSFMDPTVTNPATGTKGALQFAGNYGGPGVSCNCRTPVQTYWKNWGPRVGITYQVDEKTVFRIGGGRVFSQGGGVGGRGGAFQGTGQLGFNTTATSAAESITGASASPSFWLNNAAFLGSAANTALFGGAAYPTAPTPGPASVILNTGNYVGSGGNVNASSAPGYADPYFSSRAPNFNFYNAGIQRAITNDLTLSINYVGNQSHHLINSTNTGTGTPRGYWSNQLNPIYLPLGTLLNQPATPANVTAAQAIIPGVSIPTFFQNAASAGVKGATVGQGLVAFPQYATLADTWGANVGNFSYNSLQVTVQQRMAHGLNFNFNYTWSKNIGDDGPFRTGFDLPSGTVSRTTQSYKQNRIDRGNTTFDFTHSIHAFGVWQMPWGKGELGGGLPAALRHTIDGWQLSGIYTYTSGSPVQVTYAGCNAPLQGQCMPDLNPAYIGTARINGKYGDGPRGRSTCSFGQGGCTSVKYFDANAFTEPLTTNGVNLIGNAPRTAAWNLRNPSQYNIDASLRKAIPIFKNLAFTFEADAFNVLNHANMGNPNAVWSRNSTTFGQITGTTSSYIPRSFEFAGHITF